jgi:acetyl esterase/lipase
MSTALLADEQKKMFTVKLEEVQNGRIDIHPPLPFNGKVEVGTEFTVKATADVDHIIDSVYASFKHKKWNIKYDESMSDSLKVIIDRDKTIGASFIHGIEMKDLHVIQNIVYAQPGVKALKYDVFAPKGAKNLPCVIIVHGGGWSTNNEDIMRGLGRELARSGKYVAFSIDYRLIRFSDGDQMPNSIVDLIEDVFGAIAHIQEHAVNYGADPTRIAMTGDSAGGHLSASVANMASMIGDRGFGKTQGVFEYKPTYLPNNKSIEEVRHNIASAIQATAPSYGIFGGKILANLGRDLPEGGIQAISPISTIPDPKTRRVAHYLLRGTKDWIKHESIQVYADALQAAGQHVIYEQIPNARHAFLDWKPNDKVKSTFRKYGLPCAKKMVDFFDSVFTP